MRARSRLLAWLVLALAATAHADDLRLESFETVGKVKVEVQVPAGSTKVDAKELPNIEKDLSAVPSAKVIAQTGFSRPKGTEQHASDVVLVTCVAAPADSWTPEFEPTVFDKVGEAMQKEIAKRGTLERFAVSPPVSDGKVDYAPLAGEGPREKANAGHRAYVEGRIALGFVDDGGPKALVCVAVCEEVSSSVARVCNKVGPTLKLSGDLKDAPKGSAGARAVAAVARRPLAGAGVLVGLALMAVGLVLLVRSRSTSLTERAREANRPRGLRRSRVRSDHGKMSRSR